MTTRYSPPAARACARFDVGQLSGAGYAAQLLNFKAFALDASDTEWAAFSNERRAYFWAVLKSGGKL